MLAKTSPFDAKELLVACFVYIIATVVLSYPLALQPDSLGRLDNADAQLNAWAISWVCHQLLENPLTLFDANTFYPLRNTLAFSEHLLLPGVIALPVLWLTDDLVLTFNLLLLFGMFISALGMFVLVRTLTNHRLAALLCGLFFSFASFRFVRLPHLQMQLYGFLPLALACTHRFFSEGRHRWAWGLAVFFLLQVLSGTYLAAITAVALGVALLVLGVPAARRLGRGQWVSLTLALGTAAALLYPFVRPYLWVNRTLGVQWDLEGIGSLSATPISYLASASRLYRGLVGGVLPEEQVTDFLFPGMTLLVLGGVGVWVLASRRTPRAWATLACYLGILVTGFLISLGPNGPLYPFLYEVIVFFRGLRALTRFGLLPLLSLAVLSGFALSWWLDRVSSKRRWAIVAVVVVVFAGEMTVAPLELTRLEDRPPKVYRWLEEKGEPGTIVELPFKRIDTRYMFWSRHHGFRSMLNGDSGFIPQSHVWMREIFLRFPSADSLALLEHLDVKYAIVHLGAYRNNSRRLTRLVEGLESYRAQLPEVAAFERDVVLEVMPSVAERQVRFLSQPVDVVGEPAALFDGDFQSSWEAERSLVSVEVHFRRDRDVAGIRFHYGRSPRIPVTAVEVASLGERGQWDMEWESPDAWPSLADLVLSLIEDPSDGKQTLVFEPIRARSLKIELHGYDGNAPQITEIEILGPQQ